MFHRFKTWLQVLRRYVGRWWYAPLVGLFAFADLFVVVIPTDGLLITAVMVDSRRWILKALVIALGSALGSWLLAHLLHQHGLPLLLYLKPGIDHTATWRWTSEFMENWGTWGLFGISLSPIPQHPAIAMAAFTGMPGLKIFLVVLASRAVKYCFLAWIATHAPRVLGRLWGLQHELRELGLDQPNPPETRHPPAPDSNPPA